MITKETLSKIKTLEDCQQYLRKELVKYKTLYNETYSDYEKKSFTEQVKAYEGSSNYVVVVSNLDGTKIKNLTVYVTRTKPSKPHPLFPVPMGFIKQAKGFAFGEFTVFDEAIDIEDTILQMKKKKSEA